VNDPVTFYTVSDAGYFPATVALLNSLRLTGNSGGLVILDRGLTRAQRVRLEGHAAVVDLDVGPAAAPHVYKAFPHQLDASGIVIVIDGDIIVTGSLDDIVRRAEAGRICVFPDQPWGRTRWFAEWHATLGLRAPLRRQEYVNSGFVAVSTSHWPDLLARWWELCAKIPAEQVLADAELPFWAADQDAFNALLASEVPPEGIEILPEYAGVYPDDQLRVEVQSRSLRCSLDGHPVAILHHVHWPKVWQPRGWLRLRRDAYVRLFPRVLFGEDVPVRLGQDEVAFWLRPTPAARLCARVLDGAHGVIRAAVHATPSPLRRRLVGSRNRLLGWLAR
jgi:hypothetical protein